MDFPFFILTLGITNIKISHEDVIDNVQKTN